MLDCLRTNPLRRPDWKWQRAIGIHQGTHPPTTAKIDGPAGSFMIRRAVRFLEALDRGRNDYQHLTLCADMPDLYWAYYAYSVHTAGMRKTLEAYLLTGATDQELAETIGMTPETIRAYEALFFNVRDKLRYREYILNCAIGTQAIQRGIHGNETELLWKLYGYFYGVHFLQALTGNATAAPMHCSSASDVIAAAQDDAVSTLKLRAAVAAKTVGVNPSTQLALLDIFTKFVEIENASDGSRGGGQQQILVAVQAMMQNLPFTVAGTEPETGQDVNHNTPIELFRSTAAELSYEEAMALAATGKLPQNSDLSLPDATGTKQ